MGSIGSVFGKAIGLNELLLVVREDDILRTFVMYLMAMAIILDMYLHYHEGIVG